MPAQAYVDLKNQAERVFNTRDLRIRQAYDSALTTTINGSGEVDLDTLANQPARNAFKTTFFNSLDPVINAYLGIPAGAPTDIFRQNMLWKGYAGFSRTDLDSIVEKVQKKLDFKTFRGITEDPLQRVSQELQNGALSGLTAADGPNVVAYLNTDPANAPIIPHINPARLTNITDMATIINQYLSQHVITQDFLKDKPYYI